MRRWVLAFALVVVAHARVDARDCTLALRVFPVDGSTDVPLNANIWVFGGETPQAYVLLDGVRVHTLGASTWANMPIVRLRPIGLVPNHHYTVETYQGRHVTAFRTGDRADETRPSPPVLERVRHEAGRLFVDVTPDSDSVAVWITARRKTDRKHEAQQLFPAADLAAAFSACSDLERYSPDGDCVEVTNVDLAGNHSRWVSNCTPIVGNMPSPVALPPSPQPDPRRALLLIGIALLSGIVMFGVRQRHRRWTVSRDAPATSHVASEIPTATARRRRRDA